MRCRVDSIQLVSPARCRVQAVDKAGSMRVAYHCPAHEVPMPGTEVEVTVEGATAAAPLIIRQSVFDSLRPIERQSLQGLIGDAGMMLVPDDMIDEIGLQDVVVPDGEAP